RPNQNLNSPYRRDNANPRDRPKPWGRTQKSQGTADVRRIRLCLYFRHGLAHRPKLAAAGSCSRARTLLLQNIGKNRNLLRRSLPPRLAIEFGSRLEHAVVLSGFVLHLAERGPR